MTKIRILLVDDHAILREGLRAMLGYYNDIEVIGEAENGARALQLVEQLHPDVVLMDIAMPEMSGMEATHHIAEQYPDTRVLILSQYEDEPYVLPLLRAGASGYIVKRALGEDLVTAIRAVACGEIFLYPSVAKTVLGQMRQLEDAPDGENSILTLRENEILQRVARGDTSRQIALDLTISVKTVEWHRGNIMNKLGVHSVAELVRYTMQHGMIE